MRGGWVALACLASSFAAGPARACPATPITYTLDGAFPAPGAVEVPLNAPLVLRSAAVPDGALWDGTLFGTSAPITTAASHAKLEQVFRSLGTSPSEVFSFVPSAPLAPNTRYAVDLATPPSAAPGEGTPTITWEFTTGDTLLPPLRLEGDLRVTYEPGMDPVFECPDPPPYCGPPGCVQTGEAPASKARVQLPAVLDGFAAYGLAGELDVMKLGADGTPDQLMGVDHPTVTPGEKSEVVVSLPLDHGAAYAPCFTFIVQGVRAEQVKASLCLDTAFPLPAGAGDVMGSAGQAAASDVAPPRQRTSTACSFAAPAGTGEQASCVACWLAALAFGRRAFRSPAGRATTTSRR